MKTLILTSVLLASPLWAQSPLRILEPVESAPKVIDGLEFSVVTQSEWGNPANINTRIDQVIMQLRIANHRDKPVLFPTFDSFRVNLKSVGGKEVRVTGGRDFTRITPNILLQPGASFSLPINATLNYKRDDKDVKLTVKDGTGSIDEAMLAAGSYAMSVSVFPTHYEFDRTGKLPAPLWSGKGSTESIGFKLNPP